LLQEAGTDALSTGWHVTFKVAHESSLPLRLTRLGYCSSLAALLIAFGCEALQNATAEGETRTISLHHIHTNEDLTVTYKIDGRYDESALAKIDTLLRDWRQDKTVHMDPHAIDLLWEVHREVGAKEPIWIVCGYRSPATNASLRAHSSGVAKFSQHMNGKAIDFYIPGVPLDQLRAAGLRAQRGGVGYYPSSGSPFVHLDTGSVRHWPRMPEAQLASVLAKGPLGSRFASDPKGVRLAQTTAQQPSPGPAAQTKPSANSKETEPSDGAGPRSMASRTALTERKPARSAQSPTATASDQVASASAKMLAEARLEPAPSPGAMAAYELASSATSSVRLAQAQYVPEHGGAAVSDVINERGYWQGLPTSEAVEVHPGSSSRPPSASTSKRAIAAASAQPALPASITHWPIAEGSQSEPPPNALAYASQPTPLAGRDVLSASRPHSRGDTTIVMKGSGERPADIVPLTADPSAGRATRKLPGFVRAGDHFDDPWLRAIIVSPSAQIFLKTTLFGMPDFRTLGSYLEKPASALTMTFSDDPHPGMDTEKFSGSAVAFMSSIKFGASSAPAR
jgi:uncharacterized protein YcbK (DUF882 family)